MALSRYTDGISTAASTETLASFGMADPSKWQVYFNDFQDLRALDMTNNWVVTTTEAGGGDAEAAGRADGERDRRDSAAERDRRGRSGIEGNAARVR